MRVTVRGWSRDFGKKEILNCEMAYAGIHEESKPSSAAKRIFR
jgi:hypothetical protein